MYFETIRTSGTHDHMEDICDTHKSKLNNYQKYGIIIAGNPANFAPIYRPKDYDGGQNENTRERRIKHMNTTSAVTVNGQTVSLITVLCCNDDEDNDND